MLICHALSHLWEARHLLFFSNKIWEAMQGLLNMLMRCSMSPPTTHMIWFAAPRDYIVLVSFPSFLCVCGKSRLRSTISQILRVHLPRKSIIIQISAPSYPRSGKHQMPHRRSEKKGDFSFIPEGRKELIATLLSGQLIARGGIFPIDEIPVSAPAAPTREWKRVNTLSFRQVAVGKGGGK